MRKKKTKRARHKRKFTFTETKSLGDPLRTRGEIWQQFVETFGSSYRDSEYDNDDGDPWQLARASASTPADEYRQPFDILRYPTVRSFLTLLLDDPDVSFDVRDCAMLLHEYFDRYNTAAQRRRQRAKYFLSEHQQKQQPESQLLEPMHRRSDGRAHAAEGGGEEEPRSGSAVSVHSSSNSDNVALVSASAPISEAKKALLEAEAEAERQAAEAAAAWEERQRARTEAILTSRLRGSSTSDGQGVHQHEHRASSEEMQRSKDTTEVGRDDQFVAGQLLPFDEDGVDVEDEQHDLEGAQEEEKEEATVEEVSESDQSEQSLRTRVLDETKRRMRWLFPDTSVARSPPPSSDPAHKKTTTKSHVDDHDRVHRDQHDRVIGKMHFGGSVSSVENLVKQLRVDGDWHSAFRRQKGFHFYEYKSEEEMQQEKVVSDYDDDDYDESEEEEEEDDMNNAADSDDISEKISDDDDNDSYNDNKVLLPLLKEDALSVLRHTAQPVQNHKHEPLTKIVSSTNSNRNQLSKQTKNDQTASPEMRSAGPFGSIEKILRRLEMEQKQAEKIATKSKKQQQQQRKGKKTSGNNVNKQQPPELPLPQQPSPPPLHSDSIDFVQALDRLLKKGATLHIDEGESRGLGFVIPLSTPHFPVSLPPNFATSNSPGGRGGVGDGIAREAISEDAARRDHEEDRALLRGYYDYYDHSRELSAMHVRALHAVMQALHVHPEAVPLLALSPKDWQRDHVDACGAASVGRRHTTDQDTTNVNDDVSLQRENVDAASDAADHRMTIGFTAMNPDDHFFPTEKSDSVQPTTATSATAADSTTALTRQERSKEVDSSRSGSQQRTLRLKKYDTANSDGGDVGVGMGWKGRGECKYTSEELQQMYSEGERQATALMGQKLSHGFVIYFKDSWEPGERVDNRYRYQDTDVDHAHDHLAGSTTLNSSVISSNIGATLESSSPSLLSSEMGTIERDTMSVETALYNLVNEDDTVIGEDPSHYTHSSTSDRKAADGDDVMMSSALKSMMKRRGFCTESPILYGGFLANGDIAGIISRRIMT